jgi:WD40 repeat protein
MDGEQVAVRDSHTLRQLDSLILPSEYRGCRLTGCSRDAKRVLLTLLDRVVVLPLDQRSSPLSLPIRAGVYEAAFVADDSRIVTSSIQDDAVRLWASDTAQELLKFTGDNHYLPRFATSSDGKVLAVAEGDTAFVFPRVSARWSPAYPPRDN